MAPSSKEGGGGTLRFLLKWILLPYIIGWVLSDFVPKGIANTAIKTFFPKSAKNASRTERRRVEEVVEEEEEEVKKLKKTIEVDLCWRRFLSSLDPEESQIVQAVERMEDGVTLVLHRNGDVEGCGISLDFLSQLRWVLNSMDKCPVAFNKYDVESILTSTFSQTMSSCTSEEDDRTDEEGFLGYCDMGVDKTPILLDHDKLVPVAAPDSDDPDDAYLPCHFHSREGVRITSFGKLVSRIVEEYKRVPETHCDEGDGEEVCSNSEKEVHFYAVPAGRVFMFAPAYVGEVFDLPHIVGANPDEPVYMEVLSLSPRVFDIFNYFTRDESAGLVEKAKNEKTESHRIKRSSTGASGYNINTRRTSESGFDTHGKIAQSVKRRCFSVLGFDEYIEGHSDGLQILRYNQTKAYTAHMDWIDDDGKSEHNFDSAGKGGNRYATILLYMTDLSEEDGGETVFVNGKPLDDSTPTYQQALADLRASEQSALFEKKSWEEKMVARCRSSLAVRPNSARAVLFYSQLPNGQPDPSSLHGGCPVITSEPKWAANLWVWNTPRAGFAGAPVNEDRIAANKKKGKAPTISADTPPKKHVTFVNEGKDPFYDNAELYYLDQYWGRLGDGDAPHAVNSYEGQVWNVKVGGKVVKTWVVGKKEVQKYAV